IQEVLLVVDQPRLYRDRYEPQSALAVDEGGFGTVFKAIDQGDPERPLVAIKKNKEIKRDQFYEKRKTQIEHEIKILRENSHRFPFIPNYHDSWSEEIDGKLFYYIVMEYIEGLALRDMPDLPWGGKRVQDFLQTLLNYLGQLHDPKIGIIHRDIKPAN